MQNHVAPIQDEGLRDFNRAAVTGLGLLGGSLFPPHGEALGADKGQSARPAAHSMDRENRPMDRASRLSHGEKQIVNGKVLFNPDVGPKPSGIDDPYLIWKHQIRWHQKEAAMMRMGRHESPDHFAFRQYYTNPKTGIALLPDAPPSR